jgi:hypothetical protein
MLDRNGQQLYVGDRIRGEVASGRFGKPSPIETIVTNAHEPCGQIYAEGRTIDFQYSNNALVGSDGAHSWVAIVP